ncbi:helix-hairpin-helix domain-containing protein [Metabacillus halosaccharovorans]|uniref:helix-hairpin-helix domain-containing protein n=1 Tax=Metabacillus halosaccharovorans TaxID=930124 RepID=UPI00203D7DBF|nr:helix-hairpin-helix domain-containing protein [Metabacillus halosaccharovorans]MCM3443105.1 helix-hairpin-helix domain-containing protein [Metabacillus halosaccharovorans]
MSFIVWIGFAIGCYFVAKKKNRRGWLWLILGIFFSYIAFAILLFKSSVKSPHAAQTVQVNTSVNHKKCPYCAETVLSEAKICKHCGRDLQEQKAQEAARKHERKPVTDVNHQKQGAAAPPPPKEAVLVNLNTATEDELTELPGMTVILAKKAIAIRDSKGGYSSIEEFARELGLSDMKFERLKPLIKVDINQTQVPNYAGRGRTVDF